MKKIIILGFLLTSSLISAEKYIIPLDKKHYEDRIKVGEITEENEEEKTSGIGICSINFENMWTSGGQYGSPILGLLKIKLSTGEYFKYENIQELAITKASFTGGELIGGSYGSNYWQISKMIKHHAEEGFPYQLFEQKKDTSSNTTRASMTFEEPKQIISLEYIDRHDQRWTDNYDLVIKDCSGNIVFSESYTETQSPASGVLKVLNF